MYVHYLFGTPNSLLDLLKRSRGGNWEKAATHIGLEGTLLRIAPSPDLINLMPEKTKKTFKIMVGVCVLRSVFRFLWRTKPLNKFKTVTCEGGLHISARREICVLAIDDVLSKRKIFPPPRPTKNGFVLFKIPSGLF